MSVIAEPISPPLGIAELAALGGVTRRTVRYYVQEGLLPAPRGVGRGKHYGPEHLERLLAVKALQEQGRSLDEVRGALGQAQRPGRALSVESWQPAPASVATWSRRSSW